MWLTVHRNSVWIRNQQDVTFVLPFISLLQVAQHVSGNHVPSFRSWRLRSIIATCWCCAVVVTTAQHQHVAIILRTWLPETCWATCKREIKDNTKVTSSWFLIHTGNLIFYCRAFGKSLCTEAQADLHEVFANNIKWVQDCIDARVRHFQHLLNFPSRASPCTITFQLDSTVA